MMRQQKIEMWIVVAGQKVTIMMEDDAYLTKEGMKWFRPRQTAFYLIR